MTAASRHYLFLGLFMLGSSSLECGPKWAKYAPPADEPTPPAGQDWYCFHATSPHAISVCKRERDECEKVRKKYAADTSEMEEVSGKPKAQLDAGASRSLIGFVNDEDQESVLSEGEAQPPPPEGSEQLQNICAIDPGSCPQFESSRRSRPTYSACELRTRAYCSAYYHEFNFYRRDEDTHWRIYCAETAQDCETWRDAWHLHLVKRACLPVD